MKAVKIAVGVLGALLVLLVVGALLVASFFDPNDYKGYATDVFQARTGRALTIEQDLRLSYFPWLAVETGGVTIGNAPGFGDRPFATVERVAARVKLMPLLERKIEIGTIELEGLALNLARDAELRGNWQDLIDTARATGESDAADEPAEPAAVQTFALEGVRLRNANVAWRENIDELRYTVSVVDLTTGAIGGDDPVDVELELQFRDEVTTLVVALSASAEAQIADDGSISARDVSAEAVVTDPEHPEARSAALSFDSLTFDRAAQTLAVDGLVAESGGMRAAIELKGSTVIDNPTFEGTVTTRKAPIAAIFELADVAPPEGVRPESLGDLDLSAAFHFRWEPREIRVANLAATALGMNVTGAAALDANNALRGNVSIPEFKPTDNFYALVRPAAGADVDLTAIDKLAFSTGFDVDLSGGRTALTDMKATALGASVEGNLEIAPGGSVYRGSVKTSRFAPDAAARVFGNMLSDTIEVAELGTLALDTRFVYDQGQNSVTLAPFAVEGFGLKATGRVAGTGLSRSPIWSGEAQVAQFSPQELITRFGLPPQPTSDPKALTRATVSTRFTVDKDSAKLENVVLALDDSRITGDFTLEGFQDPKYLFTLAVDQVDADRYLPPKARDAQEGEATAGDIELPANNTMRLDGQMQIGSLTLAGMSFQDVGSRILIGDGDAKLEAARARLYGGQFNGNFHVKAAGAAPGLALDGRATGLQLQPLIEALTGEAANFSGTGSFDLNLAGNGRTVIENVRTAGGNVSFEMVDGAIKGFNLGRTLCAAYNVTQRAPGPPELPQQTEYQAIKGSATVASGVAQSQDLLARTSFMDINGAGTLKLVEQELDYDLDAKLTGKIEIPNCETLDPYIGNAIPFDIRGTVTSPTITPDFSKLVQRAIREEVQEKLQERLQDRLRDLLR